MKDRIVAFLPAPWLRTAWKHPAVRFGIMALAVFLIVPFVLAQPDPLHPDTWFVSSEAVVGIGVILAGWAVKISTALGKDWFQTDGRRTVILSAILSFIIAGVGGYLALGAFSGSHGIAGAAQALVMFALSFVAANGSAKLDRQTQSAALQRAMVKAKLQ